ncbi:MAG: hypothetical protein WC803_12880 [Sphingomonas sp.]|jgi:hypothetical protein
MASISKDAKKILAGLPQATQDYITSQDSGGNLTSGEVNKYLATYNTQEAEKKAKSDAMMAKAPDFLKNDVTFQNLPADLKEIAIYNYEVQKTQNAQKAQALTTALEQATAQADPYWKQIIRIAQTEVSNGLADIQGDYNAQNDNLKRQIQYIQEDLSTNRTNLSLDEQAQMSSLLSDLQDRQKTFELNMGQLGAQKASQLDALQLDFQKSIDDINRNTEFSQSEKTSALDKINRDFVAQKGQLIGQAADAGLTFATKRKIAEQRMTADNQGLVESTTRQYNKQAADLASSAAYATAQYGQQTGNVNSQYQFNTEQQKQANDTAQRQIQEQRDKLQREYSQQIAKLETDAARGDTTAQAQMTELKRKLDTSLASAGLAAEKFLGSENLPSGVPSIGGVTGTLYEDKAVDIAKRQSTLYNEATAASLNF